MKLNEKVLEKHGHVSGEEILMQIDDSASAIILDSLIKLYTDPARAILRELTSNAWDSHKRAGTTKPVEVALPGSSSNRLVVQDFGVGLSREELKMYGQFGSSTKRSDNDEIGGFGLGSKSPLAITNEFTVTAIKDGKKNIAVVGRREDGRPSMKILEELNTSDPNGVKVELLVPYEYVSPLSNELRRDFFLGWDKDSIEFSGYPYNPIFASDESLYTRFDNGYVNKSLVKPDYYSRYKIKVLLGPILYVVDASSSIFNLSSANFLSNSVVPLEIGSIDLTPSREKIIENNRLWAALRGKAKDLIEEYQNSLQETVDSLDTAYDAFFYLSELDYFNIQNLDTLTYKGRLVSEKPSAEEGEDTSAILDDSIAAVFFRANERPQVRTRMMNVSFPTAKSYFMFKNVLLKDEEAISEFNKQVGVSFRALAVKHSLNHNDVAVFHGTMLNRVNWCMAEFLQSSIILSAEDVIQMKKEYRANLRAKRSSYGTPVPRVDRKKTVRLITSIRQRGSSPYSDTPLDEVDTAFRYMLIPTDHKYRNYFTRSGSHPATDNGKVIRYGEDNNVKYVLVNSGWNTAEIEKKLALITVKDLEDEYSASVTSLITEDVKTLYVAYSAYRDSNTSSILATIVKSGAKLDDEHAVDLIKQAKEFKDLPDLAQIYSALNILEQKEPGWAKARIEEAVEHLDKYKMLECMFRVSDDALDHVVEYVNWVYNSK